MIRFSNFQLTILSAILCIIAWPPNSAGLLLCVAFVPLLIVHDRLINIKRRHLKFYLWTLLMLFIFNLGTTWWVINASFSGFLLMIFANTFIMSLPFLLFSQTQRVFPKIAYFSLIVYYLSMEYFHFNWSAAWPWLTLGKGFANSTWFIQWYEYSGELGGSLLILVVNVLVARALIQGKYKQLWKPSAVIVFFAGVSIFIKEDLKLGIALTKNKKQIECVISQPNIDPYNEKFDQSLMSYVEPEQQINLALLPTKQYISRTTRLILLPETAIIGYNDEATFISNPLIETLEILSKDSNLSLISGAETLILYANTSDKKPTSTARFSAYENKWYDNFNTALNFKAGSVQEIYHKSKLVAGVEKMPFQFLEQLSINLGGSSGSLGTSDKAINFTLTDGTKVAPLICYESIFGDYVAEFVKDSAEMLSVITNDGWWGETDGYKQHVLYGAIRCIETRREMIRSANTGISAHIDRFGRIKQQTLYNENTAFKCLVTPSKRITFFVKYGNIIGKTASVLSVILALSALVNLILKKKNPNIIEIK
jgi:apolipoprotein N-acyltransferase